jgi:succinate dehydrogenase / fumarate reductase cytochrome b subunit
MVQHLLANSYSLRGENEFNTVVKVFGYLPFVSLLSIGLIYIPILFHAIYGLFVIAEMQGPGGNIVHYPNARNILYTLQRWSGRRCAAVHRLSRVFDECDAQTVRVRRGRWACGRQRGRALSGFRAIAYDAMLWRFESVGYTAFYVFGIAMAVFHFANGCSTSASAGDHDRRAGAKDQRRDLGGSGRGAVCRGRVDGD